MFDNFRGLLSDQSLPIAILLPLFAWVDRLSAPIVTVLSIVILVLTALVKYQEYIEKLEKRKKYLADEYLKQQPDQDTSEGSRDNS